MASRSRMNLIGWLATLVATAACAGAAIAAATMARPPEDLRTAPKTSEIAVGEDHFDDARDVQLSVTGTAPVHLFAPSAGKVTAFPCAQRATVSSGGTPLSIDGNPKLALATAVPLWRDLTLETRGDDVRAFQDELARLGFPLKSDGVMGQNTFEAAKTAFAGIGVTLQPGVVAVASLVWLPAATVTVSTCEGSVGADVQQGMPLAALTRMSPRVSIVDLPTDLLPGARLVKAGTSQFRVEPDGEIHVPDVAAVGLSVAGDSPDADMKPIPAQLVLVDPVAVSVVPPGAVYNVRGSGGCVASRGVPYGVHILGSQLGETLVGFVKSPPPTRVDTPPERTLPCE